MYTALFIISVIMFGYLMYVLETRKVLVIYKD